MKKWQDLYWTIRWGASRRLLKSRDSVALLPSSVTDFLLTVSRPILVKSMIYSPLEASRVDTGSEQACFSAWCEKADCSLMIATPILGCSERTCPDCCTSYRLFDERRDARHDATRVARSNYKSLL